MEIKRGDIYYIHRASNYGVEINTNGRPAIIVSNDAQNDASSTVEVVYLTSQQRPDSATHTTIWCTGRESTAVCEQINTVDKQRLGAYVCRATEDEMVRVNNCLKASLDLSGVQKVSMDTVNNEIIIKLKAERDIYRRLYEDLVAASIGGK